MVLKLKGANDQVIIKVKAYKKLRARGKEKQDQKYLKEV